MEHVIVIGGGVGGAVAHDLALRGFRVTLLEKGELTSGATGRHHGLLHSGARYALHDVDTAAECMAENTILKRIVPEVFEKNGGLFVAVTAEDLSHKIKFMENCLSAGIPAREISREKALSLVPELTPKLRAAVMVPDATMDAYRLPMSFMASARMNGADIRPFTMVTDVLLRSGNVFGVTVRDMTTLQFYDISGDIIINAAGAWGGDIAAMAGIRIPIKAGPGVMVSIEKRVSEMVINRLHPAGDGDIIVPQRNLSVLGTSAWLAEKPDDIEMPDDHVNRIISLCSDMIPILSNLPVHAAWSASRPLIVKESDKGMDPSKISRSFAVADHAGEGARGFISLLGGKATTMRAMAEETADHVCRMTGRNIPCVTAHTILADYRKFHARK